MKQIVRTASCHVLGVALIFLPSLLPAQTLQHRYSFVSDASDSVGGAAWNGTLNAGNNPATINNGLMLPGTGTSGNPSGYVSLPNGIVSGDSSVTVECWVMQNAAREWAQIWSFGVSGGSVNFALIPSSGTGNMRAAFAPNGGEVDIDSPGLPSGVEEYVAVTYNSSNLVGNLFLNGVIDGVPGNYGTTTFPSASYSPGDYVTTEDVFGLDPYSGDDQFNGTIYELRIWNGAVSQRYISASALLGSTVLVTNLTPTSASVTAGPGVVVTGTEQATVSVQLPQTGASNLLATGDATNWTSGNTNVLMVNSGGLITGVGVGTTTVSATVAGVNATSGSITVTPQTLMHRYSFVGDASDSVGGSAWNGTVVAPTTGSPVTINHGLMLPGATSTGSPSGYVTLPTGIIAGDSSVTVECWVTQNQGNGWAELWDFGINNQAYNFALIPYPDDNNNHTEVANFNVGLGNDYIASASLFPNVSEQYVCVTYNNSSLAGVLSTNGVAEAAFTYPSTNYSPGGYGGAGGTVNNYLGADIYGDWQFSGTLYELRIWNGAVSPLYQALTFDAGSSVVITNTTASAIDVTVTNTQMVGSSTQQATLTGTFPQLTGNLPGSLAVGKSGNTNILTVSGSGLITAVGAGGSYTTISATLQGLTATSPPITNALTQPEIITEPAPLALNQGDTAVLTVGAIGGDLSYQWFFDGTAIAGATNSTLTLSNISLSSQGSYTVVVSNTIGTTNSIAAVLSDAPILENRYSFVSDASDSVSGANGTLVAGDNPATISDGLMLPGTGTSGNPSGYVSLPNGIVSRYTSVTVECWVTQNAAREWAQIWSFGVSGGSVNFGLIPSSSSGNMRVAFTPNGGEVDIDSPGLPTGVEEYVAVTYDSSTLVGNLYLNAALDSGLGNPGTTTFPNANYSPGNYVTTEDVLGLDPFGGDDQFDGTLSELRIWKGAVSPLYLTVSAVAGPSIVVTNVTPQSLALMVADTNMTYGASQPVTVDGTFDQATNVGLNNFVTNWASSATNILTVSSTGLLTPVGIGSATISATVAGVTGTIVITVSGAPVITQQPAAFEDILAGGTFSARLSNIGLPPFNYFWYYNGGAQPISGATAATLTLPNVQSASDGSYTCVVSNSYGSVTSTPTVLTVVVPTPYQSNLLALNPLAYWPLDEASGPVAYDLAGGYNGTYFGNVSFQQPGPANTDFGSPSYAAGFDGSTAYVDIPEGPFNINGAITIMGWVSSGYLPTFGDLIGHGDPSWRISLNGQGFPGANDGNAAGQNDATSGTAILDGNWHFLVYTYSGNINNANNGLLYLDGSLVASNSVISTPAGDDLDVWIGGAPDYNNRFLAGNIANVAVLSYAISATDVQFIYAGQGTLSPVALEIARSGSNVVLTWPAGTLLQAPTLLGPWTTNSAAVSPYTTPASNQAQFYKVLDNP